MRETRIVSDGGDRIAGVGTRVFGDRACGRDCAEATGEVLGTPELRAVMSMARLWRNQGKREEARELLAPVYGWFTEGFETLDLKKGKALLDELAA